MFICHPYLLFHIYDHLNFPCLVVVFVNAGAYESHIHKYFNWKPFFIYDIYNYLIISSLTVIFHFSNVYEILHSSQKYFTIGNHICSLIFMIIYAFLVWQTYFFSFMPKIFETVHPFVSLNMCTYIQC